MHSPNRNNQEKKESQNELIARTPMQSNTLTFDQLNVKIINGAAITNVEKLDYQGIEWQEISHISRTQFRVKRLKSYKPQKQFELVANRRYPPVKRTKDQAYFVVDKFLKGLKPQSTHVQLPNTVKAVSRNDIYYLSQDHLKHCSTIRKTVNEFDHNVPEQDNINFRPVCIAVDQNCFVLGGFEGGLFYQDILTSRSVHIKNVTMNLTSREGDIINQVDIYKAGNSSSLHLLTAQNDKYVQMFDLEQFRRKPKMRVLCNSQVNVAKFSPISQNTIAVFCDKVDAEIMDVRTSETVQQLKGHSDYGLTLDWHPNGRNIATGNQDGTTRIWDVRKTATSVHVLPCQMGNSYNVKYNQSGDFLAVLECSDYLNIYSVNTDYSDHQVQDFLGQSTGLAFYEDRIFVGVNMHQYDGILQMSQRNSVEAKYESKMAEYSI